jgi:hypothetical protein
LGLGLLQHFTTLLGDPTVLLCEEEARIVMALMPRMARGSSHFAFSVDRFMALIFIIDLKNQ